MHGLRVLGVITISFLCCTAQMAPPPPDTQMSRPATGREAIDRAELDRELLHKAQVEQQKKRFEEMQRDSQKLLELATQLKQYVDKSGANILSMDVVRKAEEMEKLARQVKNNMRAE